MKTSLLSVAARWSQPRAILLLSVLLGLCAAPVAQAQETSRWAGVEKTGELSYRVWACNPAAQHGQVQLVDASQRVLYEQFSSAVNFGNKLNLRELPDGAYTFVVVIGHDVHRFGLQLSSTRQRLAALGDDQLPGARPRPASVAALTAGPAH